MGVTEFLFSSTANLIDQYNTEVILGPVLSEGESFSSSVTSHAIENGEQVSDHVHVQPYSFSIVTVLSDKNDLMAAAAGAILGADKSVEEKMAQLKQWWSMGELLIYNGPVFSGFFKKGYDMYAESMVITGLNTARSVDRGSGIEVAISLRKITIADTQYQTVDLPQPLKKTSVKGKASTKAAATAAKTNSILSNFMGGLF